MWSRSACCLAAKLGRKEESALGLASPPLQYWVLDLSEAPIPNHGAFGFPEITTHGSPSPHEAHPPAIHLGPAHRCAIPLSPASVCAGPPRRGRARARNVTTGGTLHRIAAWRVHRSYITVEAPTALVAGGTRTGRCRPIDCYSSRHFGPRRRTSTSRFPCTAKRATTGSCPSLHTIGSARVGPHTPHGHLRECTGTDGWVCTGSTAPGRANTRCRRREQSRCRCRARQRRSGPWPQSQRSSG